MIQYTLYVDGLETKVGTNVLELSLWGLTNCPGTSYEVKDDNGRTAELIQKVGDV